MGISLGKAIPFILGRDYVWTINRYHTYQLKKRVFWSRREYLDMGSQHPPQFTPTTAWIQLVCIKHLFHRGTASMGFWLVSFPWETYGINIGGMISKLQWRHLLTLTHLKSPFPLARTSASLDGLPTQVTQTLVTINPCSLCSPQSTYSLLPS